MKDIRHYSKETKVSGLELAFPDVPQNTWQVED